MDYLSRNSVVLDLIFHGFSLSLYFTEITLACIHARIQMYTHARKVLLHSHEDNARQDLAAV